MTRNLFGALQNIEVRFINASSLGTEGIDLAASYGFESGIGRFDLSANWNHIVGAINVFDRDPPLAQINTGFGPIVHDPGGRVVYIALDQQFRA